MELVTGYNYQLNYKIENQLILVNGLIENKPTILKFTTGSKIELEFRQKRTVGEILKINHKTKKVQVKISETQTKKIDIPTLISKNRFTEVCFRLENNKQEGPYRSSNPSESLLKWREAKRKQYEQERNYGYSHLHPTSENDLHLRSYPLINLYGQFGFKSLEQLYNWFTVEDIEYLRKEGFNIIIKQKGLDYFDSFYSSTQMVIVKNEEDYNKILYSKSIY